MPPRPAVEPRSFFTAKDAKDAKALNPPLRTFASFASLAVKST
jgi:hypothetical protein